MGTRQHQAALTSPPCQRRHRPITAMKVFSPGLLLTVAVLTGGARASHHRQHRQHRRQSSYAAALADEYFPPSQNEPASFTYSAADDSSFSTDLSDSFGSADSFGSGLSDSYGSPSFEDPIISDNSGLDSYGGTSSYDAPAVPSLSGYEIAL